MTRWLVTGAAGMLGRDLTDLLRPGARTSPPSPGPTWTSPTPPRWPRRSRRQARRRGQLRRVDRRRRRRGARGRGPGHQRPAARPTWPPPARAPARCSSTPRPTTSSTAAPPPRTPRARRPPRPAPTAAPSWPASGPCAPPCRTRATSSAPPGCTAPTARTSSRRCSAWPGTAPPPAWSPTSTASPPGPPTSPPRSTRWSTTSAPAGVYHATSSGQTTWFGFAEEIFPLYHAAKVKTGQAEDDAERVRLSPRPITTADYPTPAQRPAYSVLGHDAWHAAGIAPISDWKDALHRAFPGACSRQLGLRRASACRCRARRGWRTRRSDADGTV